MANKNDNLGYLGIDFQFRLVKTLMEDKDLFRDLHSIIDQNTFTDPRLKTYVGIMKDYYDKHESFPSYEMMGILLKSKSKSDIEQEEYDELNKQIKRTNNDGVSEIKNLSIKFFRQQNIIKTANEILRIAGDGDMERYEECVDLLSDALHKGVSYDLGQGIFDELGDTLSEDYREPIPTGVGKLDESLNGGLGKGELGVIIGSSGFGKTTLTTAMASYAATYMSSKNLDSGYKVLQIVFEDGARAIKRKHIARLTNIEACALSRPENIDFVKETITNSEDYEKLKNNIRILNLPTGEVTATKIKEYIKKLINSGFTPDMVVLDYFECLDLGDISKGENEFNREGKVMRKLENMCKEYNFALWVATQGTKDSVNADVVTMDKAGGSFKKMQIAHVIFSISRTNEDISTNKATLALLKNRAGKSGAIWMGADFNNGTCRISTDCVDECQDFFVFSNKKEEKINDISVDVFKKIKEQRSKVQ